jgi:hypothetical protein
MVSGSLTRDSGDEQSNESLKFVLDSQVVFISEDQSGRPKDYVERLKPPLEFFVEDGEHTFVIQHLDDRKEPPSAGSIDFDIEISFVPAG